jgi:hypothetical protein
MYVKTYGSRLVTPINRNNIIISSILALLQKLLPRGTRKCLFRKFISGILTTTIRAFRQIPTFSSAKLEHFSHSFLTCVIPPINKTAGFVLPTEEVGELTIGEADELFDDISPMRLF